MNKILGRRIGTMRTGKFPGVCLKREERGFTLIEILISMVLITGGLLMFMLTSASVTDRNAESSNKGIASTLAQDKIEDIKNIGRTISLSHGLTTPTTSGSRINPDYASGAWSSLADEDIDAEGTVASGNPYKRTWDVTEVSGENYFFSATVDVTWESGSQSVSLQTQVTQ